MILKHAKDQRVNWIKIVHLRILKELLKKYINEKHIKNLERKYYSKKKIFLYAERGRFPNKKY